MDPEENQVTPEPTTEGGETNELEALRTQLAEAQQATATAQAAALTAYRSQLLAEHAGRVVPDLVQGTTPDELAASVERAQAAYSAIADQVKATLQPAAAQLPNVARATAPAAQGTGGGGGSAQAPAASMESLTPMQKLQAAFSRNGKH